MMSDWPCLTSLLTPTLRQKFHYTSVHNPIQSQFLRLTNFPRKPSSDQLFGKKKSYKLPQVSHNFNQSHFQKSPKFHTEAIDIEHQIFSGSAMKKRGDRKTKRKKAERKKCFKQNSIRRQHNNEMKLHDFCHKRTCLSPLKIKTVTSTIHKKQKNTFKESSEALGKALINKVHKVYEDGVNSSCHYSIKQDHRESYFSYMRNIEEHLIKKIDESPFQKPLQNTNSTSYASTIGFRSTFNEYSIYQMGQERESQIGWEQQRKETANQILKDVKLLIGNIDRKSVINTIRNVESFKKKSSYFNFKTPQIRILYHCLLAEISMYHKDFPKAIQEFQFAEYHCRKNGLEPLTIFFLWELSNLNMYTIKNEEATECLKNLIEMAVLENKKKAIKYVFERLSLLYYYRGNSLIGQYYLKKSEEGLTVFQEEIYFREYSKQDEVKRLEMILFNEGGGEKIIKRKNNPKFEEDISKDSFEDYEKKYHQYCDSVNAMLKSHDNCKKGMFIKKLIRQNGSIGTIQRKVSKDKATLDCRRSEQGSVRRQKQRNSTEQCLGNRKSSKGSLGSVAPFQGQIQNATRVIKTHLSMNRENMTFSRDYRWKKFLNFLFSFEQKLQEIIFDGTKNVDSGIRWGGAMKLGG